MGRLLNLFLMLSCLLFVTECSTALHPEVGVQPLSKIAMHKAVVAVHEAASIGVTPSVLGLKVRTMLVLTYCIDSSVDLSARVIDPFSQINGISWFILFAFGQ